MPLDPAREGRARGGLEVFVDPRLRHAVLQMRRAILDHPGRPTHSRLLDWARWCARDLQVDEALLLAAIGASDPKVPMPAELPEEFPRAVTRWWRPRRREPPTPEGQSLDQTIMKRVGDPSVFASEPLGDGGTFREQQASLQVRARGGTKDAMASLFVAVTVLGVGAVGWYAGWNAAARYVAPIVGLLLMGWSVERYLRRDRRAIFEVGRSGLELRAGRRRQSHPRSAIRYVDTLAARGMAAGSGVPRGTKKLPESRWLSYTAQRGEMVLVLGLDEGEPEARELFLAGPYDPVTAHTVAFLLERELQLER